MSETDFREVYKKLNSLGEISTKEMDIVDRVAHLEELKRLQEIALKLLDDMETRQST